ncbi:MAG TPA: hypothetical protein ENK59_05370, partial [Thioploca sp.]|nr:hypothetical protein [Thioploca sp.]
MNDNGVQHFARLKETSDLVWPIIEREVENLYENLRVYDDDKAVLKSEMEVFFKRRRHKLLLRPYLTRLAYEFYGGKDWKKNIDVFAAVELFNISTYQSNLCFDKKLMNEVANNSNQYIASMLTLSLATKLIQDSQIFSSEQKNRAIQLLNESNNKVYLGQYIDLNMLTFSKFKSYQYQKNQYGIVRYKKKHFYHDYVERCNKIGGSTFEVCLIGALLNSNTDLEKVEELRNLYYKFGS